MIQPASVCVRPNLLQRILLCTDGTVTHILEDFAGERITVRKLHEEIIKDTSPPHLLDIREREEVMVRTVVLQGVRTGRNFIYAETLVRIEALKDDLLQDLLHTDTPLGILLRRRRMETFRELVAFGSEDTGECARHFGVDPSAMALARTYRVSWGGRPVMLIMEKFPVDGALQEEPARAR